MALSTVNTQNDDAVATIIWQQFGHKATVMTGARIGTWTDNSLTIRFKAKGKTPSGKRVNCLRITLNALDTYDVEFIWLTVQNCPNGAVRASSHDVYADQLHAIIESHTGLYLSL